VTGTLGWLALAVCCFVGSHFALSSQHLRGRLVARLGERGFLGLYSALALALLAWSLWAYAAAPALQVWVPPIGLKHLSLGIMPFAFVLLVAGYTSPGPTAVRLDAQGPANLSARGIHRVTRHPVMWAIALWSVGHLLANGDAASMILFGGLAVLSLSGAAHIDARRRAHLGARWDAYAQHAPFVPLASLAGGRARSALREIGWLRLGGGLVLYGGTIWLHPWLFGAVVWPL
jgi:uncharacterized membrane protein